MPATHPTPDEPDADPATSHVVVTVKALKRDAGAYHRPVRDGHTFDRACGGSDDGVALVHATAVGADTASNFYSTNTDFFPCSTCYRGRRRPSDFFED